MSIKRILSYIGVIAVICGLIAARGHRTEALFLLAPPLALAIWLMIDRCNTFLGISTAKIKSFTLIAMGASLIVYSAWAFAHFGESQANFTGILALVLGAMILINVAIARVHRR